MSLLSLPNELLLNVADPLNQKDLNSFLRTNIRLAFLLTSRLHTLAVRDRGNMTALQWAARNGYESLARIVLEKGADVNFLFPKDQERVHMTALQLAAQTADQSMVKLLLQYGADASVCTSSGTTALHWAVKSNSEAIVLLLLQYGANLSAADERGDTALLWAIGCGFEAIIKVLLEHGADLSITKKGSTPLHLAAQFANEEIISMLLEYGADASVRDTVKGRTAIEWATLEGREGVARVLREIGKTTAELQTHLGVKLPLYNTAITATESRCVRS